MFRSIIVTASLKTTLMCRIPSLDNPSNWLDFRSLYKKNELIWLMSEDWYRLQIEQIVNWRKIIPMWIFVQCRNSSLYNRRPTAVTKLHNHSNDPRHSNWSVLYKRSWYWFNPHKGSCCRYVVIVQILFANFRSNFRCLIANFRTMQAQADCRASMTCSLSMAFDLSRKPTLRIVLSYLWCNSHMFFVWRLTFYVVLFLWSFSLVWFNSD